MDHHFVTGDRLQGVETDIFAAHHQVGHRLLLAGPRQLGDQQLHIVDIPAFGVVKAIIDGVEPEAQVNYPTALDVGRKADCPFGPAILSTM